MKNQLKKQKQREKIRLTKSKEKEKGQVYENKAKNCVEPTRKTEKFKN